MVKFEIKDRDGLSRIGVLETKHGRIETPTLLPVINPNRILIEPKDMKRLFGIDALITNSYVIYKNDGLRKKAVEDDIHSLLNFDGTVMTDSGTFQTHVYGEIGINPVEIVKFQREIGSDIGTILDVFTEPYDSRMTAKKKMIETLKRARESVKIKGDMLLSCTIQGGVHEDLREICAREMSKIECDLYPIGGVVPLMENQRFDDLVRSIVSSKKFIPKSKPVHLFGAGHPIVFPISVALGVDLLDSASYAKYARDDRLIFPWGTEKLDELKEIPCNCPVCSKFDADELKKMNKKEREKLIALHNLYISFSEIKRIKKAIREGSLWEIVEEKASLNPAMFDALKILERGDIKMWMEKFESPSKRSSLFYVNSHTLHRPIVSMYQNRILTRYRPRSREVLIKEDAEKPYSRVYRSLWENSSVEIVVKTPLGPVPLPIDEMYPVAQSIFPKNIDDESKKLSEHLLDKFIKKFGLKIVESGKRGYRNLDIDRVRYTIDMQFGLGVSDTLLDGKIKIVKSRSTGKLRNVFSDNEHVLSMRAHDGLFTLKIAGGKRLHRYYAPPRFRVIVKNDISEYIKMGRSVFAKFVVDCDVNLRPFDECIIVSEDDDLLGIGRTMMNREEMLSFEYGVAVKTREGIV